MLVKLGWFTAAASALVWNVQGAVLEELDTFQVAKNLHESLGKKAQENMLKHGMVQSAEHAAIKGRADLRYKNWEMLVAETAGDIKITELGGDATGRLDSTAAFEAAFAFLESKCTFPAMGIKSRGCGGAKLNLEGGKYLISKPLKVPQKISDFSVVDGTVIASSAFPYGEYLVVLGEIGQKGDFNEAVFFRNIMFESSHRSGGLYLGGTFGGAVQDCFFHGFVTTGLYLYEGHEVFVSESWFGELYWDQYKPEERSMNSTALVVNGNDHIIINVIVFNYANLGVLVMNPATFLVGVHIWNAGPIAMLVKKGAIQTRMIGCYLDFSPLVVEDPDQILVSSSFFLSTNLVIQSVDGILRQMHVTDSIIASPPQRAVEIKGKFTSVSEFSIDKQFIINSQSKLGTTATAAVRVKGSKSVTVDFGPNLIFPWIEHVIYSVEMATANSFVMHYLQRNGTQVTVVFYNPVNATVHLQVSQETNTISN